MFGIAMLPPVGINIGDFYSNIVCIYISLNNFSCHMNSELYTCTYKCIFFFINFTGVNIWHLPIWDCADNFLYFGFHVSNDFHLEPKDKVSDKPHLIDWDSLSQNSFHIYVCRTSHKRTQ